ncbi:hypothetical protein BDL97_08G057800 [Sphagnum fallax]|nr:hypothetical protein BDL97_08G057800 [Sphagnum fallax]
MFPTPSNRNADLDCRTSLRPIYSPLQMQVQYCNLLCLLSMVTLGRLFVGMDCCSCLNWTVSKYSAVLSIVQVLGLKRIV